MWSFLWVPLSRHVVGDDLVVQIERMCYCLGSGFRLEIRLVWLAPWMVLLD